MTTLIIKDGVFVTDTRETRYSDRSTTDFSVKPITDLGELKLTKDHPHKVVLISVVGPVPNNIWYGDALNTSEYLVETLNRIHGSNQQDLETTFLVKVENGDFYQVEHTRSMGWVEAIVPRDTLTVYGSGTPAVNQLKAIAPNLTPEQYLHIIINEELDEATGGLITRMGDDNKLMILIPTKETSEDLEKIVKDDLLKTYF